MTRVGWIVLGLILLTAALFASVVRFGGSAPRARTSRPAPVLPDAPRADGLPRLAVPVVGVARGQIVDTWGQARGEGRQHHGTDIMAPGGRAVVAAAAGPVEKLFESRLGGTTLYQRTADGRWTLYYAHLAGYAPGMREGRVLHPGELLGYVGDTGDAGPGNYHLHFSIGRLHPGQRWWQAQDVNAFPALHGGDDRLGSARANR